MLPHVISPATYTSLSPISFRDQDILKIIHFLSINKVRRYDDIFVRLLKICDSSIIKPLSIIFKNYLKSGSFSNNWKMSKVVPIYRKGDTKILENYRRSVFLLSICSKIFERIIFNPIFKFLNQNFIFVQIHLDFVHLTHVKTSRS